MRLPFFRRVKKGSKETRPTSLPAIKAAGTLRSNAPRRAFAIRYAQLFGLFRREAPPLRLRHTGKGSVLEIKERIPACAGMTLVVSTAFSGPRAQSPSAGILILTLGDMVAGRIKTSG